MWPDPVRTDRDLPDRTVRHRHLPKFSPRDVTPAKMNACAKSGSTAACRTYNEPRLMSDLTLESSFETSQSELMTVLCRFGVIGLCLEVVLRPTHPLEIENVDCWLSLHPKC